MMHMMKPILAGALAVALAAPLAAAPALAKGGKGSKGHHHGHKHFHRAWPVVTAPVCLEWGWVWKHGRKRFVCVAWY